MQDRPIGHDIEGLARRLREADHLDPEVRAKAAKLLDELAGALGPQSDPSGHLARGTAELVNAVHEEHEPSLIEAARGRLEGAVVKAEVGSPAATDLVLRLIDALSGIGI